MAAKQKTKWLRSEPYLAWVRTLPCVVSGQGGCVAHHMTGYGSRGNTKVHDFWTIPLTGNEHNLGVGSLHSGVETWEAKHGSQWNHIRKILSGAIVANVLTSKAKSWALPHGLNDEFYCREIVWLIEDGILYVNKKAALGRENIL